MSTKKDTSQARPSVPGETDALQTDIERTREDLGDTVEALAAKADVKARAKVAATDAKERARETANAAAERATHQASEVTDAVRRRPLPVAAVAGGLLAAASAVVVVRRWRARAQRPWWRRVR
jgi:hypothetical protein